MNSFDKKPRNPSIRAIKHGQSIPMPTLEQKPPLADAENGQGGIAAS